MFDFPNPDLPITNPVLTFAFVMSIILVVPIVLKKIKISGLVGLILSGAVIGPFGLGLFERDQTFILLGTVGLLYIMFVAGLEIDLNRFKKYKAHSLLFGSFTFLIPQVFGTLASVYILGFDWLSAILLASMFASHTLLAYPIASRLGIVNHTAVTTSVGGTIITDTAALLVLAVCVRAYQGTLDGMFWIVLGISILLYTAAVFWLLPMVGRWFFKHISTEGEADFVFILSSVFLSAYLSQIAGLEPIIGAFMAGLALNRLIPAKSPLMNRIEFVGNTIFIPFFLLSVGMLVNYRVLFEGTDAIFTAGFMVFFAILFKFSAAYLAGWVLGYSHSARMVMFGLSNAQAAATLAAVLIAFQLGIFDEAILNGTIVMILVTCLISPHVTEKHGRILAMNDDSQTIRESVAAQRILIPLANPTTAETLMDIAFAMREKSSTEPVYPLTVVRDGPDVQSDVAKSERMLSHAVIYAASANIPVSPVTRVDMNISSGITRAVKERRITNVIIGWNGQSSATEAIFGGVLDQLLTQVRHMIMVCKMERRISTIRKIHFAIPPFATLEPGFMEALRYVMILANQIGAELSIIGIEERMSRIKACVKSTKQPLTIGFVSMDRWTDLPDLLQSRLGRDDLFILQSAREGTLSWRPGLDRLPSVISSRFPENGFIAIYPSEIGDQVEGDQEPQEKRPMDRLIEDASVIFPSKDAEFEGIVSTLMSDLYPKSSETAQRRAQEIIVSNDAYNSELTAGIVLLETVADDIDEARLLVAICRNRIAVPKAPSPICAMAVVIHPANESADEHLDRLNQLARRLRNPDLAERLARTKSVEQVIRLLNTTDQSG
jgi:Kef-type K+ transport system membrane component KefB